jgi:hypothetical protein
MQYEETGKDTVVADSRYCPEEVHKSKMKGKLKDLGVNGRIILECILKRNGRVLIGFILLSIWTIGWLFCKVMNN